MGEGRNGFLQFTFWLQVKTKLLKIRLEMNHSSDRKCVKSPKRMFLVVEVEVLKLIITKFQKRSSIEQLSNL